MKNFLYLVQGQAALVKDYLHLNNNTNSDAIFLTYDQPLEGAVFFPKSTWAEGRNKLYEEAMSMPRYDYYIYCDDDISFESGNWEAFQNNLLEYKPAIAIPVFNPRTIYTKVKGLKYQCFLANDEQLIAFHYDVMKDHLLIPYQSHFDSTSWWATSETQELMIQNFYPDSAIQFNDISVLNKEKQRYDVDEQRIESDKIMIRDWLKQQFKVPIKDIYLYVGKERIFTVLSRTIKFKLKKLFESKVNFRLSQSNIERLLNDDSPLLKQFNDRNS